MKDVVYTDPKGFSHLVRVEDKATEKDYSAGIQIGPPDLSGLDLPEDKLKTLQKALVESYLVNAELIHHSRTKLFNLVRSALPTYNTRVLVMGITAIYQESFYSDNKFYEEL